jgi:hypothetical protein
MGGRVGAVTRGVALLGEDRVVSPQLTGDLLRCGRLPDGAIALGLGAGVLDLRDRYGHEPNEEQQTEPHPRRRALNATAHARSEPVRNRVHLGERCSRQTTAKQPFAMRA